MKTYDRLKSMFLSCRLRLRLSRGQTGSHRERGEISCTEPVRKLASSYTYSLRASWIVAVAVLIFTLGVFVQPRPTPAGPLPEWSNDARDVTPSGRVFLGQFSNQTVSLLLSGLPAHSQATVSFDLFIINSWDGNCAGPNCGCPSCGPDVWDLTVAGGPTLLHTTFSNVGLLNQAYPDTFPGGDNPAGTGATEVNTLGYSNYGDSVYHLSFNFPHSIGALQLNFSAMGLQDISDESWGLDNVEVAVDGNIVYSNDFDSSISPTNDGFENPTVIGSLPFSDLVNTALATTASDDPAACNHSNSVWYSFTPPTNTMIEVDTFNSNYFAEVSVWTGSRGALTQVGNCGNNQLVFNATAGTPYYFMVAGSPGGILRFLVRNGYNLDLTVNPNGTLDRVAGKATISGTIRCSEPSSVGLSGELRQRAGRFTVIHGSFSQDMPCSPPSVPWSASIAGENGPFGSGPASANIFTGGCGTANCDSDNVVKTIRLKGGAKVAAK